MAKSAMDDLDDLLAELKTPRQSTRMSVAPASPNGSASSSAADDARNRADSVDSLLAQLSAGPTPAPSARSSAVAPSPSASIPAPVSSPVRQSVASPPARYEAPAAAAPQQVQQARPVAQQATRISSPEEDERDLLRELNAVRRDPAGYADLLARERKPYYRGRSYQLPGSNTVMQTSEGVEAVDEAISLLRSTGPLPEFVLSPGMSGACRECVRAVGQAGQTSCDSVQRLADYGRFEQVAAEISSFGDLSGRDFVMQFLVCDGVPNRDHRNNILDPAMNQIGISVGPHNSSFKKMACVNFTPKFTENLQLQKELEDIKGSFNQALWG